MVPAPNQNFVETGQIPTDNYYQGGVPNLTNASNFGGRIDYNASESDRFFFRDAGTTFHEQLGDWTYESPTRSSTAARQRQDALVVGLHGQLDESAGVDGVRHPVLDQPLLRRSAAPGHARVQAHRRRASELPRRFLRRGGQVHDARHQHRRIPGRLDTAPTAASTPRTSRPRATSPASRALTRCAAASTIAWRCGGTD